MSDKNVPWVIHRLDSMVGSADCATQDNLGAWVRAVPLPYSGTIFENIQAAWWILTGRAYAVRWPEAGDLERAIGVYRAPKKRKGAA